MTTIILIRHGQSVANLNRVFAGNFNAELSELGHMQARRTAEAVTEKFKIDKIYSSDLIRAYDTARPISEITGIEIIPDCGLREIYAGKWEGMEIDKIGEEYPDDFFVWRNDICNSRCTDGESMREVGERLYSKVKEIAGANDERTVVITTHAAAIRALMARSAGDATLMNTTPFVPNASYSVVKADSNGVEFLELGHDEHLEGIKTTLPPNV